MKSRFLSKFLLISFLAFQIQLEGEDGERIPDGTLIKSDSSPEVYYMDNGVKRWVTTMEVLNDCFGSSPGITNIDSETILKIPYGLPLLQCPFGHGGNVITVDQKNFYVLDGGYKRLVTANPVTSDCGFDLKHSRTVSQNELDGIINGAPVTSCPFWPTGTLLISHNGGETYVIEHGQKRQIDPSVMSDCGLAGPVFGVPQDWLDKTPTGIAIFSCPWLVDGLIGMTSGEEPVFYIDHGAKRHIPDMSYFSKCSWDPAVITRFSDAQMWVQPISDPLSVCPTPGLLPKESETNTTGGFKVLNNGEENASGKFKVLETVAASCPAGLKKDSYGKCTWIDFSQSKECENKKATIEIEKKDGTSITKFTVKNASCANYITGSGSNTAIERNEDSSFCKNLKSYSDWFEKKSKFVTSDYSRHYDNICLGTDANPTYGEQYCEYMGFRGDKGKALSMPMLTIEEWAETANADLLINANFFFVNSGSKVKYLPPHNANPPETNVGFPHVSPCSRNLGPYISGNTDDINEAPDREGYDTMAIVLYNRKGNIYNQVEFIDQSEEWPKPFFDETFTYVVSGIRIVKDGEALKQNYSRVPGSGSKTARTAVAYSKGFDTMYIVSAISATADEITQYILRQPGMNGATDDGALMLDGGGSRQYWYKPQSGGDPVKSHTYDHCTVNGKIVRCYRPVPGYLGVSRN